MYLKHNQVHKFNIIFKHYWNNVVFLFCFVGREEGKPGQPGAIQKIQ